MAKSTDDYNPIAVIKELSENIYQPDKFADIFCAAAKKQKIIDDCLKGIVRNLLESDSETKEHVKSIVKEHNDQDFKSFLIKIGAVAGSIILLFIGAIFHAICTKFM